MFKIFKGFHLVEDYHKAKKEKRSSDSHVLKKLILALITLAVTLIVWNLPTESFGIQNLTVVQQRIIAIFVFATLMWIFEVVPSWATSIAVIVTMLLTTSNSAFKFFLSGDVGAEGVAIQEHHGFIRRPYHHAVHRRFRASNCRYENWP